MGRHFGDRSKRGGETKEFRTNNLSHSGSLPPINQAPTQANYIDYSCEPPNREGLFRKKF